MGGRRIGALPWLLVAGRVAARRFDIRQNHEINVTPFIDVMLVLLIVFIIAAPLATTAINVDIAAGSALATQSGPPKLERRLIDAAARIYVDPFLADAPTDLDQLGGRLPRSGDSDANSTRAHSGS